jgi:hypothetical protein
MKNIVKAAALLAAVGSGATTAFAQGAGEGAPEYDFRGFTVRGGVVIPIGSNLGDLATTLIGIGAELQLPRPLFNRGDSYLSADLFFRNFSGENGTVWPIALNHRMYLDAATDRRSYFFVGVGVAFINVDDSGTRIMARGGLGTELSERLIAEATLTLSDATDRGVRANSIGIYLGYRF